MNGRSLSAFLALATSFAGGSLASAQDPAFHATFLDDYDLAGATYSDVWAVGTTAYIGRFGLNVVDVIDVSNPSSLSLTTQIVVPSPNDSCSAQDIKAGISAVDSNVTLGFVSFDYNGPDMFGIYDITNPASPTLLTTVSASGYSTSHNTSYRADGWIASANSQDDKVALFDLSTYDPAMAPASITAVDYEISGLGTGFVHDITLTDDFLYVAEWDALLVYDVSALDMGPPVYLGEVEGYSCHAVWATADNEYVVTTDERQGGAIRLWKMTDNGSSVTLRELDSYVAPPTGTYSTYSAHNPIVLGDRVYVSNYSAGVIVFQIDRTNDTWERVASYDTSTQSSAGYYGGWGVYPLLGPEMVVISDLEEGLFTLDLSAIQFRSTSVRPDAVTPFQTTAISVEVEEVGTATLDSGTIELYTSIDGGPFTGQSMAYQGGNTWSGNLPALDCGSKVDYYFSADTISAETFTAPAIAPTETYTAYSTLNWTNVFSDDFESNKGWSVVSDASLTSGEWERVTPNGTGMAPGYDADGSGKCFVTENGFIGAGVGTNDLDGGPTTLTSPVMDFSAGDGVISYSRWQANSPGDSSDGLAVEISNGGAWTQVENVYQKAGGWVAHRFRVSDYVTPNSTIQVRFQISDNPNDSVTEACVDGFSADQFCQDPLATATFRNGSGSNTACLSSAVCRVNNTWSSDVTYGAHAGASFTVLWIYELPGSGTFGPYGEFLVDLSSQKLLVDVKSIAGGGTNTHSFPIPADVGLTGIPFTTQAGILGGGVELCNAYDYVIGF